MARSRAMRLVEALAARVEQDARGRRAGRSDRLEGGRDRLRPQHHARRRRRRGSRRRCGGGRGPTARRSCARSSTRPRAMARPGMTLASGPGKTPGNSVMTSMRRVMTGVAASCPRRSSGGAVLRKRHRSGSVSSCAAAGTGGSRRRQGAGRAAGRAASDPAAPSSRPSASAVDHDRARRAARAPGSRRRPPARGSRRAGRRARRRPRPPRRGRCRRRSPSTSPSAVAHRARPRPRASRRCRRAARRERPRPPGTRSRSASAASRSGDLAEAHQDARLVRLATSVTVRRSGSPSRYRPAGRARSAADRR